MLSSKFTPATISTLDRMLDHLIVGRRVGNSTRLVNRAIDILMSGNICKVEDHYGWGTDRKANQHLFDRIVRRLQNEHPNAKFLTLNRDKCEIQLGEKPICEEIEVTLSDRSFKENYQLDQHIYRQRFKPIDQVTTEALDAALRQVGIIIDYKTVDKIIDLVELLENKGDKTSIAEIKQLEAEWEKKRFHLADVLTTKRHEV